MTITGFTPLVAREQRELRLTMQELFLAGRILPAGARLVVRHVFCSEEPRPLEVVYCFALPRDAALRRFRITGAGFSVHSRLEPVGEARRAYEEAIEKGHLTSVAREYKDGLINLTVGNVRPGESVQVYLEILAGVEARDDGFRFRFPFTLAPAYHPQARAAEGEIELPEEEFGDLLLPRWLQNAAGLHRVGFDLRITTTQSLREVASPSHPVRVGLDGRVRLAPDRDVPDRDLVLDARVEGSLEGVVRSGRHFVAMLPSTRFGRPAEGPRRVVILLDRSGSMGGTPLEQAKRGIQACLCALGAEDSFGLVAFHDQVESFRPALAAALTEHRSAAGDWLRGLEARGGTELAAGITAASQLLNDQPGDILVFTDGQVFGTDAILAQVRRVGIRLHCLGIGTASQDRFLAKLARDTGGVSRMVNPGERVDLAAVELFASIGRPVATGLQVTGAAIAPEPPSVVFAGTPVVIYGESDDGALALRWDRGTLDLPLPAGDEKLGDTIRLLQGARLITDNSDESTLTTLSKTYGLASRTMALVAVVERPADQPGKVPHTQVVPVGMPQDVEFRGYFCVAPEATPAAMFRYAMDPRGGAKPAPAPPAPGDLSFDLATLLAPDGGLPANTDEERILATLVGLLYFLSEGHTPGSGAFRAHVQRMLGFLDSCLRTAFPERQRLLLRGTIDLARIGKVRHGNWQSLSRQYAATGRIDVPEVWERLARAFPSLTAVDCDDLATRWDAQVDSLIAWFDLCLDTFDKRPPFRRAGQLEYHQATVSLRRGLGTAAAALDSDEFVHSLYRTLQAWGIGQRASILMPPDSFCSSLRAQRHILSQLDGLSLEDPNVPVNEVSQRLWQLIDSLDFVDNESTIVACTKTLHHLLPDLVVPIDRAFTGRFFGWSSHHFQRRNRFILDVAFTRFARIARAVRPSRYVGPGWRTCPAKIVDNAVVGFVQVMDALAKEVSQ